MQAKRVPAEEFPRSYTVIHFPDNLTLIGQTVYVESDYTGQRSAFFTHNFLVPRQENPPFSPDILSKMIFLTDTDWNELPELDTLPFHENDPNDEKADQSGPLPFDENRLMQLLYVILDAVNGAIKVYVILPGLDWTIPMLMWIYSQLPEPAAKALGFTTYAREPVNLKYLHLIFMDKGTIPPGDAIIERDYVFDFEAGYFSKNLPKVTEPLLLERIDNFELNNFELNEEEPDKPVLAKRGFIATLIEEIKFRLDL